MSGFGSPGSRTSGWGAVVALGSPEELAGFALAGAVLVPARSAVEALQAWEDLDDAVLVVLTAQAAAWLGTRATATDLPLTVVVPA